MRENRTLSQIVYDLKMAYSKQFGQKFATDQASDLAITEAARKMKQGRYGEWIEKNGVRQVRIY